MITPEALNVILERITQKQQTDQDMEVLRRSLRLTGDTVQWVSQDGKFNTNVGEITGGAVHIGDRIYQGASAEAIRDIIQSLLQELQAPAQPTVLPLKSVDELVEQVRSRLHDDIQRLHGTMPLWGVDHWVPLGELFVDVNILEELSSSRRSELADLWQDFSQNPSYRSLDRIGLGRERQRVSGLEVLEKHTNLMVVGKPGSGKTTYLQRVVTECNAGNLQAHKIPVLIRLREFVEDGRDVAYSLERYLEQCWQLAATETQRVLNQGRSLLMLDGLDEVTGDDGKTIAKQIKQFARAYPQVQMVVTCRTQSFSGEMDWKSLRFTFVEVADFNESQVRLFIKHWFQTVCADLTTAQTEAKAFLDKLFQKENKPIRELATTPILLSLTCAVFQQKQALYSKRSKLYEEGLELLLDQWDRSREVERDEIYRDLSLERKLELLSYLAVKKFEQEQYVLFEQEEIEGYIAEFLGIGQRESRAVLRAIESQHGLLIERSQKVWSFSHLTFQEYLVARSFLETCDWKSLAKQIVRANWREVFLLVAESFLELDDLFFRMCSQINELLATDTGLQEFLNWLTLKSNAIKAPYKSNAIRAFYFTISTANIDFFDTILPKKLAPALFLDFDLMRLCIRFKEKRLDSDFSIACALDGSLNKAIGIVHGHGRNFHDELIIPRQDALRTILKRIEKSRFTYPIEPERTFEFAIAFAYDFVLPFSLYDNLQRLEERLEILTQDYIGIYNKYWEKHNTRSNKLEKLVEECNQEWLIKGKEWDETLKLLMIEHRGINPDSYFNEDQLKLLKLYHTANSILVSCLNNTCAIKEETRIIIEDYLFLPIAEIEKRKREKAE